MKKTKRNALFLLLAFTLIVNLNVISYATEAEITNSYEKEIEKKQENYTLDGEIVEFETILASNCPNFIQPDKYVPNIIVGSVIPEESYYKITITNYGIDKIDILTLNWKLYDDITGKYITSGSKTFKKLKVGTTTYKWYKSKSNTVQERLDITGSGKDGKEKLYIKKTSAKRWNFAGGKYGTMKSLGGQKHHMPSDIVSPLSTYNGPCIRMLTEDHRKTASYGSKTSARNFREKEKNFIRQGRFLQAQKLGINDIYSLFGYSKYKKAISEMIAYTRKLGYYK